MFKNTFLRFKTRKALKTNKVAHHSTSFDDAKQIGILFTSGDETKLSAVNQLISQLKTESKQVETLEYLPLKKDSVRSEFPKYSLKSFNFQGNLVNSEAQQFINRTFDYLFVIDQQVSLPVQNLLAQSKAKCRVGKSADGMESFLDLMIEMTGDHTALIQAMINYTKKLS